MKCFNDIQPFDELYSFVPKPTTVKDLVEDTFVVTKIKKLESGGVALTIKKKENLNGPRFALEYYVPVNFRYRTTDDALFCDKEYAIKTFVAKLVRKNKLNRQYGQAFRRYTFRGLHI